MSCFLALEGLLFCAVPLIIQMEEDLANFFFAFGSIYIVGTSIYTLVKISKWKKENKDIYDYYTEWRTWTKKDVPEISESEIEEQFISASVNLAENDKNKRLNPEFCVIFDS